MHFYIALLQIMYSTVHPMHMKNLRHKNKTLNVTQENKLNPQ